MSPLTAFAPLAVRLTRAPGGKPNAMQSSYPPEPGGPVPGVRAQPPGGTGDAVGDAVGDALTVAVGVDVCGGGVGTGDVAVADGREVLGGAIVCEAGGAVSAGASGEVSSAGVGVGAMVGTVGAALSRLAGGDARSVADGLTTATPWVDGGCEVAADSTSQMVTAIALTPRTRSTRMLNELAP
jgi:hypothetical protein